MRADDSACLKWMGQQRCWIVDNLQLNCRTSCVLEQQWNEEAQSDIDNANGDEDDDETLLRAKLRFNEKSPR